jgi:teichuronic acid biosynthesis glycosyltransferase TuaG
MKELNSLVSIITPSYNTSRFIGETIECVINQTYKNWELLITDDFSVDNSVEIIESYMKKDSRIKLLRMDSNIGAAAARNVSIENAKGRYIAFLDSDDIWKPNKLERQLKFMSDNNYAFTYTAYELINEEGEKLNKIITVPESLNYKQYLKNTIIGCLTVIIDREKTGDFRMPLIKSSHDMALWLQIMKRGFVAYGLNEVLASYRLVSNSNTAKKWKAAQDVWKVYRDIENLSYITSLYLFCWYTFNAIKKRI